MNEDEQAVRQVYPDAYSRHPIGEGEMWRIKDEPGGLLMLGRGLTEAEAFADARSKLPKPSAALPVEERTLSVEVRKQLWLTHGCGISCLYGDDGEMQCGRFIPAIDFRRDPEAAILEGIDIHCQRRWSEVQAKAPIPEERTAEMGQLVSAAREACEIMQHEIPWNAEKKLRAVLDHIEGTPK